MFLFKTKLKGCYIVELVMPRISTLFKDPWNVEKACASGLSVGVRSWNLKS